MKKLLFLIPMMVVLFPAGASAHWLNTQDAKDGLWGASNYDDRSLYAGNRYDNDMKTKAYCLEWQYGWNLVSWWIKSAGHPTADGGGSDNDAHTVFAIGAFKRANGEVVERAFTTKLDDYWYSFWDYPGTDNGACPYNFTTR